MQIKNVAIEQIIPAQSQERLFVEETNPDSHKPDSSLFIRPVFLHSTCNGFIILYGFDYISEIYKYGGKNVPAFVIPKSQSLFSALNIVTDFIRCSRPLWPIEVARILQLCNHQRFSDTKKSAFFKKLTAKDLTRTLEGRYLALIGLDPLFHKFLIEKKAPLKTWFLTAECPPIIQDLILILITECQPSLSTFEEISRNLLEILRRETITPEQLAAEIKPILAGISEEIQPSQKLEVFRNKIHERRFPQMTIHRERVNDFLQTIQLPAAVKIEFDPNFEERGYRLKVEIRTPNDIVELTEFLNSAAQSDLKLLLEIL
ncbi:MAG TPA: hypothetical protein P5268_04430 [Candidatus Marinimicrobia bacterium]|mgnify:CR=1 FL=1|nr:hypothetical protein [Candidatus Neomarinimicrobiota bacterium]HRU92266.1 hypothetical protein [Candidatus Neomarinimicrobiota bacterium]